MKRLFSLTALVAVVLTSCENPFSPRGPFTPRLVVYSVLSNDRTTQFVRVSSTYNPPDSNPYDFPYDSSLSGVTVKMNKGSSTFAFQDTLIHLGAGSSASTIHAYAADSCAVEHDRAYTLEVTSTSLGVARSTITVPSLPTIVISPRGAAALDYLRGNVTFAAGLSGIARSSLVRMFVEFETREGQDTIRHRWQVPMFVSDTSFSDAIYPAFKYNDRPNLDISYPESSYVRTLARIVYTYSILVKFRYIVFEVFQIGEPLYIYSNVVNGFKDELSLRTDEADYSNISGGYGVFGAFTRDEIKRPFPDNFFYNPAPEK